MEFELFPTPPRATYRGYDPLSQDRRMYAILLNETYDDMNMVIRDGETAVATMQLKLLGTTNFSILGTGRLAVV